MNRKRLAVTVMPLVVSVLLASGCSEPEQDRLGSSRQAMGMDWGSGGGSSGDSLLAAPVVTFLREVQPDGMLAPTRIASGPDGRMVVSDGRARRVWVLDRYGLVDLAITDLQEPLGVAVDGQGNIYAGDQATGAVNIYNAAGRFVGQLGSGVGEFEMPGEIAYNPSAHRLYVVDSKADLVKVFSPGGDFLLEFGGTGSTSGLFRFPTGIVVDDAAQLVYVVDHSNARIQVFDANGTYQNQFGSYGSKKRNFTRPQGLALDSIGRFYVTDAFQSRLQAVDKDGLFVDWLGEWGADEPGQLKRTMDAAMDPDSRLWVTSHGTGKVVVFGIDSYTDSEPIPATVEISPDVLVANSNGKWVHVFVELPGYDLAELAAGSVTLNGTLGPEDSNPIGDHDGDGIPDLKVRYQRAKVVALLGGPGTHTVTVTGSYGQNEKIVGSATVEVK